MKKVFCVLIVLAVLMGVAWAEGFDLSALSFQELAALRDRAQLEMFSRAEWQEVTVPQGVYQVGVQIPAGTWTVTCKEGYYTNVDWGEFLNENGQRIEWKGRYHGGMAFNPDYRLTEPTEQTEYTFTVQDGDYIIVAKAPATFTPGASAPTFTFK